MSKEDDIAVINNCLDTLRAIVWCARDVLDPRLQPGESFGAPGGGPGLPLSELRSEAPDPAPMDEPFYPRRTGVAGGRKKYQRL